MRIFPSLVIAILAVGCASDAVEENLAYRRLVDGFSSYDQCLAEGDFRACYQTLTLCTSGVARLDLENRPQDGKYVLSEATAVANFAKATVYFRLDTASSAQLPGSNPWELVEPLVYDCP